MEKGRVGTERPFAYRKLTVCTAFIGYDNASGRRGWGFRAKSEHHSGECNFYWRMIFILILSKTSTCSGQDMRNLYCLSVI